MYQLPKQPSSYFLLALQFYLSAHFPLSYLKPRDLRESVEFRNLAFTKGEREKNRGVFFMRICRKHKYELYT